MYLLDTDHLVILQRQCEPEYGRLNASMGRHDPDDFFLSIVSFHEQSLGANAYIARARAAAGIVRGYAMLERCLDDFLQWHVLSFDEPAADQFQQLRRTVRIGTMDLRIAATALSRDLRVLTRNTVDFGKVPGLAVEDWTTDRHHA
jgi:tRNA(fMet)-specific endonuclease VapC